MRAAVLHSIESAGADAANKLAFHPAVPIRSEERVHARLDPNVPVIRSCRCRCRKRNHDHGTVGLAPPRGKHHHWSPLVHLVAEVHGAAEIVVAYYGGTWSAGGVMEHDRNVGEWVGWSSTDSPHTESFGCAPIRMQHQRDISNGV